MTEKKQLGIVCECGGDMHVSYTRQHSGCIQRRRKCIECGSKLTTIERPAFSDTQPDSIIVTEAESAVTTLVQSLGLSRILASQGEIES